MANMKNRLDNELVKRQLVISRSQAESYVKLGKVKANGRVITKASFLVDEQDKIELLQTEQYVSRAGLKLASVAKAFGLDFKGKVVLDVGSSTGGFTDYALKHGAKKVIAVDVGTNQLHPSLHGNPKIELHEKTNILDVGQWTLDNREKESSIVYRLSSIVDIILVDVSFVSLRQILPHLTTLASKDTLIVAMLKPQFEVYAEQSRSTGQKHPSTSSGFRKFNTGRHLLNKGVKQLLKISRCGQRAILSLLIKPTVKLLVPKATKNAFIC
jgi:23S rRNA (cytidine1920-2'-O)/16S rRNA (cytidine1409-2'-O)-methyltransferase